MMRTGWVCVHTQSSIHGSSMHIRGQERPDSVNKEAKQITLASSQCMSMSVHANTHTYIYKYTKRGGHISSSCALSLSIKTDKGQSRSGSCTSFLSANECCYSLQHGCCSAICESVDKVGVKSESNGLVLHLSTQAKHHSCLRHYAKKFSETEWEFHLHMCWWASADVQPISLSQALNPYLVINTFNRWYSKW